MRTCAVSWDTSCVAPRARLCKEVSTTSSEEKEEKKRRTEQRKRRARGETRTMATKTRRTVDGVRSCPGHPIPWPQGAATLAACPPTAPWAPDASMSPRVATGCVEVRVIVRGVPWSSEWRRVVKMWASRGKMTASDAPLQRPSFRVRLVYTSDLHRCPGASGPPEVAPSRRTTQIATLLARIRARSASQRRDHSWHRLWR